MCNDNMGILCEDECQQWFHCECINMNEDEYTALSNSDATWQCSLCLNDFKPFNNVDSVDVFHFDFQQNMPTLKLPVGEQFYQRLLWTYLFGIYSASNDLMAAYMWHELIAKRGANDVISCLAHFIHETSLGRTGTRQHLVGGQLFWSE